MAMGIGLLEETWHLQHAICTRHLCTNCTRHLCTVPAVPGTCVPYQLYQAPVYQLYQALVLLGSCSTLHRRKLLPRGVKKLAQGHTDSVKVAQGATPQS